MKSGVCSEFKMSSGAMFITVIVIFTVPAQVPILTAYNTQKNSVLLEWGSPLQTNGILIGYLLQYHLSKYPPSNIYNLSVHFMQYMVYNHHSSCVSQTLYVKGLMSPNNPEKTSLLMTFFPFFSACCFHSDQ